jgi:hypothetical protein
MYKHINCDEVQRKFGVFEKYAKTEAQCTHSSDPTGENKGPCQIHRRK